MLLFRHFSLEQLIIRCRLEFLEAFLADNMLDSAGVLFGLYWVNTCFDQLSGEKPVLFVYSFGNFPA